MTRCRFCGLALDEDDEPDYHDACVEAPLDDDRPRPDPQHPIYGPTRVTMEQ